MNRIISARGQHRPPTSSPPAGTHFGNPALESVRATAFRLEPLTDAGIYSLDGEVVPYGPIAGRVLPAAAQVLGELEGGGGLGGT